MMKSDVALGWKSISGYRHQVEGRENEDAVVATTDHPLFDALMIVADGMGGHDEPKLAAETAAAAARDYLLRPDLVERYSEAGSPLEFLRQALRYANQRVVALGVRSGRQPGSTLTVAAVADGKLHVTHAGDGSTMLLREGRLRPLVGGEEQRLGNRPREYLGRAPQLETEEATETLARGDRVLICTDGLTRYFNQAMVGGGNGLREVLGRASADPQAIANQLTAHSRTDQYDDDTTVVVAEVVEMRNVSVPRRTASRAAPAAEALWRPALTVGVLFVLVLAGAWYALSRWTPLGGKPSNAGVAVSEHPPRPAGTATPLPRENLVLLDAAGRRFFSLHGRPSAPPADPVDLQAMRVGADGRLQLAGHYRWDPGKGTLSDLRGKRSWSVDLDVETGTLRAPAAGTIQVITDPAGATCWINGARVGETPVKRPLRAGLAQVRVLWDDGREKSAPVYVPAGDVGSVEFHSGSGS
jgi:serine/threonine protein phosphatase PrpC